MRIAVFASDRYGSSHHRAYEPMLALARRGHTVWINAYNDRLPPDATTYDVAYLQRYQDLTGQQLARRLKAAGMAVVWDHDDDIEQGDDQAAGAMKAQRRSAGIRAMVRLADVVTTTSTGLASHYRELGASSVWVVENYLGNHYRSVSRADHDGVVIGWAAWADHMEDWEALSLQSTIMRVLEQHPHVHVESVGPLDLGLPRDRYTRKGTVPFKEIAQAMASFDIGIAPLTDTAFNRARSNVKLKEYAATGSAWLASPVGPYTNLGEKQGGRLVADDRWHAELDRLVTSARLRRRLAKHGARWAAGEMLDDHTADWETPLVDAIDCARSRRAA